MLRGISIASAGSIGAIPTSEKGQPNGVATLGADGKVPSAQLPPLQHDVGKAANQAGMLALAVTAPAMCLREDFTPPHIFFLTADPATTLANWTDTGELGAGGANPTSSVGTAPVNGASTSYMRADAAPSIDQNMIPQWTAIHTFIFPSDSLTPTMRIGGLNAQFEMYEPDGAADAKRWNWWANGTTLTFRALNDAGTAESNAWTLTRAAGAISLQQWGISGSSKLALSNTNLESIVSGTFVTGADGVKLWLAKYTSGTGHSNAPTTIGAASTYAYVGGREFGNNGYAGIGFSYVSDTTNNPAVWIGWQERNTAGSTNGDFIIATRSLTTDTAPIERLRITNLGSWGLSGLANTGAAGQFIKSNGAGSPPTWDDVPAATLTTNGTVKQGAAVANAAGASPTKAEFDALLASLRAAGVLAT